MKCPYCYKRVGDMPDHLVKSKGCHKKHSEKLGAEIREVIRLYDEKKRSSLAAAMDWMLD